MKAYPRYELKQVTDLRQLMDMRAEETPDDTAFFFTDDSGNVVHISCRRFREDVEAVGTLLLAGGYKNRHIGLLGTNSYEWIVAFFAITTSGNVAVPLDARVPIPHLVKICEYGDCKDLFYSKEFAPALPAFKAAIPGFQEFPSETLEEAVKMGKERLRAGDTSYADYELDREAMCALVYTSGTTGTPKGVMLSQKNIAANINQACANFILEGNGMSVLPFHHMFGLVVGVFMVFNYRYPCYIVRNLRNIPKDFQIAKPECLFVVPMVIESFAKQFRSMGKRMGGQVTPEVIKAFTGGSLRFIICGGAPLQVMYVKMFRQFGIEILNGYGITECAPVLAVNRNEDMCDGSVGPVLFGCEVKIDEDGEILAKGDNVMLGYYKDPEATKQAMLGGWFHTGDLGRIEDHFLFITGRTKNLIITSSGENISPEELEDKLQLDPAVAEVIVYEDNGVLAAMIYPEPEAKAPQAYFDALVAKMNQGEPPYRKIQKVSLKAEPFVRNSTGKIIRNL